MPLSVFHNQNKKAKLVIISNNALLGGYGDFLKKGVVGE